MVNLFLATVPPLFILSIGLILGALLELTPVKTLKGKAVALSIFAAVAGVGCFLAIWFYSWSLMSITLFNGFASIVKAAPFIGTLGGPAFMAALLLLGIFEASLTTGFGLSFKVNALGAKRKSPQAPEQASAKPTVDSAENQAAAETLNASRSLFAFSTLDSSGFADEQALKKDEQSMMELFLYGKVTQVTAVVNPKVPEGYCFEGAPQVDWETKRSRHVLDSLARKGFVKADLTDQLLVCSTCGSANIRIKKLCPECMSPKLHKEGLIEHFSCGAVQKQTAFECGNGDLVCPKCKGKLQLIGADYRILPPAYTCMNCNARNSEPLLVSKCIDCGATINLDEEPEVFLYKYTANSELSKQKTQQIKPIEVCSQFFKTLGYTVVTPAFVSGKSGTRHLFDMLVLGKVGWVESQPAVTTSTLRKDNGNTVIQMLISSKPSDMEEITRTYGMINDIECDSLIFVIPGMTDNARNYASAYNMKISEGKTIEEALANSKIPRAGAKND